MKLLIDTNIVLDVLLKRIPFYQTSAKVLELAKYADIQEYVSASAITDIYYIAYRQLRNKKEVRQLLQELLKIIAVAPVSGQEINSALKLTWNDFEDSVQYSVASMQAMDGLVTRNRKDYKAATLKIWQPEQILQQFTEY